MVKRQMRNKTPGSCSVQRSQKLLAGFVQTHDRTLRIQRRRLFNLQGSARREFPCQLAICAQRVRIDGLHGRETGLEIKIEKRKEHLGSAHIFSLRGHTSRVPESFVIGGLHSMIVRIEGLQPLGGIVGVRRGRHGNNRMYFSRSLTPLVWYQRIFQTSMIEPDRFTCLRKQVDYRSATQAESFFVNDQILSGPAIDQEQYVHTAQRYLWIKKIQQRIAFAAPLRTVFVEA